MRHWFSTYCYAAATLSAIAACSSSHPVETLDELTGTATVAITNAPADATCIQISVSGARSVIQNFDVSPGESTILSMKTLPLGLDTFSAVAFNSTCAAVVTAQATPTPPVPTWVTVAPVTTTVAVSPAAAVLLELIHNGNAVVAVNFNGDDAAVPDAGIHDAAAADAAADAAPAACSPEAAASFQSTASNELKTALNGTTCLPGSTASGIAICNTAACDGLASTCSAQFATTAFTINPATLAFSATANLTISGGAAGSGLSCSTLVVTAPGTTVTGTLQEAVSGLTVTYVPTNVVVVPGALAFSGCGTLDTVASAAATVISESIATSAESALSSLTFAFICP
jgi:hypothetical protein